MQKCKKELESVFDVVGCMILAIKLQISDK